MANTKKYFKKILIGFGIFVAILCAGVLSLQLPVIQNFLKDRLVIYLEKKVKTKVSLDRFYVTFPNSLVMENLYLQGQTVDTLLYAKKFDVGLNIPKIFKNTIDLTSIDLDGVKANVVRNKDGSFNFDYFIDAFARKDSQESESKPFVISLDKIKLQNINVSFIDNQARNDISLKFKYFDTRVKTFDLDRNSYAVGNIVLDGLKLRLKQDLLEEVAETVDEKADSLRAKKPMKLALNGIKFTNFNVDYGDDNSKTYAKILFNELNTKINKLDIENQSYEVDQFLLKGANIDAKMFSAAQKEATDSDLPSPAEKSLDLLLGKAILDDVKVSYNNTAMPKKSRGMDFNHLDFSQINFDLRDFKMQNGTFAGTVKKAEIKEKNNLEIRKFNTDFVYGERQAYLKNLYLETSRTVLRDEIVLNYNSIEQLSANPGAVSVSANIYNSKIGLADLLNFAPDLRNTPPFNTYPNGIINLDARIKGTMNEMQIANLQASGLGDLKLALSGVVRNATDPEKLFYDLKIRNLGSSAKTILKILPKNTLPSNISLPSYFAISGVARGTTKVVDTKLKMVSTLGNVALNAVVDMRKKNAETYVVNANLMNLQIGKIIQNKDLGIVRGTLSAKGRSFDFKNGTLDFKGNLAAFDYQKYRYQNVDVSGKLNSGRYNVHLLSRDPNANLNLLASGELDDKNSSVKLGGTITKLDLYKLGFYQDPLILAGNIDGEFSNLNPDFLNGYLNLDQFAISDTKEVFPIQEMRLKAETTANSNALYFNSQVADFTMTGKYKLSQIFGALQNTVSNYYDLGKKKQRIDPHQYFDFTATLKDDDLIRKFLPELKSFENITMNGNYNADSQKINVDAQIPNLKYGENLIENASFKVYNENDALQYQLQAQKISSEKLALNQFAATGNVANNVIEYRVSTKDDKNVEQFLIAGNAQSLKNATQISLNPDGLKLNYNNWNVAPDNVLRFGKNGIFARNFVLSNGESSLAINSENENANSPLNVDLKNFKIETITEMLKKDSLLAKGTINGNVRLKDYKNLNFTSDVNVTDLVMYGNPVGNIAAKVNTKTSKLLYADVALTGFENDMKITGDYNIESQLLDLEAEINRLQMKSVQGFTLNAIENTEGYLSGNFDITGKTESPKILGKLKFNDVGLEIVKTGSNFRHLDDEIRFASRGIVFDDFKVKDSQGNALTFDGDILTQNYKDFAFDLKLRARDFMAVDSQPDNDKMMFGILAIDADLGITGNLDLPQVDGKLAVTDKTDFTFVIPQSSPTLKDREGIVEFIDQDQIVLNETIEADSIDAKTGIKGMDVNVNISLTKEAKISLLIDKASGDFVKLQGEAELTGGVDPSGKTTLVGVYQVESGAYEMSFNMIKRKFDIQKGSTITWTGEPTTANLDLTAIYKTNAAPIDLVQQQLSEDQLNYYKQRIPFNTLLVLKGELLKPVISFDIQTDENNNAVNQEVIDNVETKLTQLRRDESELNKQVFALLILNHFIGDNPFQSQSGISAGTMARQSVSQILSQQLNNIAQDLIAGVDLTFDFDSYEEYSSGNKNTRTDLNVNLSKKLLNDRLKITVGSNFGIEGEARQNEEMTNIAGNITADYALSKDGRYTLRAYQKNQYQVALQGQIIETGVGFVITLDYTDFKDIFQRAKQNREIRRTKKALQKNSAVEFK